MACRNMLLTLVLQVFFLIKFVACTSLAINRTGWTVTADSFQPGNEPAKAIDGDVNTFWHTQYSPTVAPLPHWIVVDMKATYNILAVGILPRPGTNSNGRIGGHRIEVSTDNNNWQLVAMGTYNNDNLLKTTKFVTRQARYVKITATSEAQSPNNQWTSIAEINIFNDVVNNTPTPYSAPESGKGLWEKTVDFPLIPAAVALLPDSGQVLMWTAFARDAFGGAHGFTQTAIYDPATGISSQMNVTNTQHDMFCPGISQTFDGDIIVTGGSNAARTSIYDFASNSWISGPNMKIARGYQSSATCSDGRIFTIGGSWSGGRGGKNGEIYDPNTNTWTLIPNALVSPMLTADAAGIFRADNHAWLFGWKNQTVFQAGPSIAMNWYNTAGSGSTTGAGKRADDGDAMTGIAVMYDAPAGKILTAGGAPSYQNSNSRTNAYVITIGEPSTNPIVTKVQNMAYPRSFSNGVVLPSGQIIVFGGQAYAKPFFDTTAAPVPELFDPTTQTWTQLNPMAIPRNYHSVAILMPDGTIMSAGGGVCGTCAQSSPESNHFDAEIFIPPYLLNSDGTSRNRPTINTVASTVRVGGTLSITTNSAVTEFALMRFGTATHTVDTDQRRIPLKPSSKGNTYTVTVPADPGVALPGYWMLFALDSNGTPSLSKTIKVTL